MSEETQVVQEEVVKPQATEENLATTEQSEPETPSGEEQAESKVFTQEEVDKIVQKRLSKLERKLERQQIEQETRAKVQQEQQVAPIDIPKPKESDFEVYSDYLEALSDWKVDVKLRQREIEQETRAQRESQKSAQEREAARQQELIEKGEEKYDDFEEVIKADRNEYSRAAYLAMLESDISAELLYHLASNPEEGKRIAALPAFAQAKEIGKLEDKLLAKPQKQISKAPAPINPIGTGKASGNALSDDLPIEEWMRRRQKQVRGA
jgi:hypothetical protein